MVSDQEANLMAGLQEPPDELLHALKVGVVDRLALPTVGGSPPVRHHAHRDRPGGAREVRRGREREDEIREDPVVLAPDTHL
jgi:hypothetical protein